MTSAEFKTYQDAIADDYQDLSMDLLSKYDIFARDVFKYEDRLAISSIIVEYLVDELVLSSTDSFDINILTHSETIKLSECLNKQLNTRYKPTFLTDVDNYKSIREGGF